MARRGRDDVDERGEAFVEGLLAVRSVSGLGADGGGEGDGGGGAGGGVGGVGRVAVACGVLVALFDDLDFDHFLVFVLGGRIRRLEEDVETTTVGGCSCPKFGNGADARPRAGGSAGSVRIAQR